MSYVVFLLSCFFLMHGVILLDSKTPGAKSEGRVFKGFALSLIVLIISFLGVTGLIISSLITLYFAYSWWEAYTFKGEINSRPLTDQDNYQYSEPNESFTRPLDTEEELLIVMYEPLNSEQRLITLSDWAEEGNYIIGLDVDDDYKEKTLRKDRVKFYLDDKERLLDEPFGNNT